MPTFAINEAALTINEVREAVAMLRDGKAAVIYNISAELFKAEGEVMICGLHAVMPAVCIQVPFLLTEKRVGRPYLEMYRNLSGLQQLPWDNAAQRTRQDAYPFATDAS